MARSIRLSFARNFSNELYLKGAVDCAALPYPSASLEERINVTGTWIELQNMDNRIIYRLDLYGYILPPEETGETGVLDEREYDVIVPYYPNAKYVAVYSPPLKKGTRNLPLGDKSIKIGRFMMPPITSSPYALKEIILPADICGKGKGTVLRYENVVYNGRTDNIYNLIVLGDRFKESEQDSFTKKANNCINYILSRPPFNSVFGVSAMNVYFVEVASQKDYYFDTEIDSGLSTGVSWDTKDVTKVCDTLFSDNGKPFWNWAAVIVNYSTKRIGTGYLGYPNQFASGTWSFLPNEYEKTFQHELGHTAFVLCDEYSVDGTYTGKEPTYPNATIELNLDKLKWKEFATPGIKLPTKNKSSTDVGCYEGANTYDTGIYRPQYNCVMKKQEKADGYYCKICTHHATKIMARSMGLSVPAPGSLLYSDVNRQWSNMIVAAKVTENYGSNKNYADYNNVIAELSLGAVGNYVTNLFEKKGVSLPQSASVFESYYTPNVKGLWYLTGKDEMYYVYAFEVAHENEIALGKVNLPTFPTITLYDGSVVGTETHVFCGSNGKLAYGKQDSLGYIEKNFEVQSVKGLSQNLSISDISVDYKSSRIMVAVVDIDVKIAAYQLMTKSWHDAGFIKMPFNDTPAINSVKIAQTGNYIHVAAKTETYVLHKVFSALNMSWESDNCKLSNEGILYYDIAADANQVYLIAYTANSILLYNYNTITKEWSNPENVTTSVGLTSTDKISSLGIAILHNNLHIVALVNKVPKHAVYNLIDKIWITSLTIINPLLKLPNEVGGMMLHSSNNQLHLVLSEFVPLQDSIDINQA